MDIEIVQAGCIPDNPVDLVSKLHQLSAAGSATGFDLVGSFITLAKLFVLKKSWQPAADFALAAMTLGFHAQRMNKPDTVHPDVLRFLSEHSCLVHVFVMTDRSAEVLPYMDLLESIIKINPLQVHHADLQSLPPAVVFHVSASEVYRAANMPTRSAAAMKEALDLMQVDPGIQRRLAHAPTSHTGNLSYDPRVMTRLMQSQTVLAARMKQRDEKEGRFTDTLAYRPPRMPLPLPEFELPSYGSGSFCFRALSLFSPLANALASSGSLPKPDLSVLCLDLMRTLKKHNVGDKEVMGRWASRAKALKAAAAAAGAAGARVNIGSSPSRTLPALDVLTFARELPGGKGGR